MHHANAVKILQTLSEQQQKKDEGGKRMNKEESAHHCHHKNRTVKKKKQSIAHSNPTETTTSAECHCPTQDIPASSW